MIKLSEAYEALQNVYLDIVKEALENCDSNEEDNKNNEENKEK